jgi:FAD/FMN-containing dehydrogenase
MGEVSERSAGAVVARLTSIVGAAFVITDPDVMAPHLVDWTRRFGGPALCVVRPRDTAEISAVMRVCNETGVPVIPQGGNTGLVGGSVPGQEGPLPIILSLGRLDWIEGIDDWAGQMSCGAGAILGNVQRAAHSAGWVYGVDLAARDTATIGGTVATNAGGIRVIAYGMTRANVVGIEAVLADGSVISHMPGLLKDNTGFDLGGLLAGSEGALAVITAVRLRLHRPEPQSTVALVGCSSYADALDIMHSAVALGARVTAVEVMDETGMQLVEDLHALSHPLVRRHPVVVLLEVIDGGSAEGLRSLEERDVAVAGDEAGRARLWRYREAQADGFATLGILHKLDVSIPIARIPACVGEISGILTESTVVTGFGIFGHLADGNLHVEFAGPQVHDEEIDRRILECVAQHGGSVSAEHGIGRAKAKYLALSRSEHEIHAMRRIKEAWDPAGILNPGVIF